MRARFGEFVIDRETHTLTRGGEEIHLSNKAFDLLEHLVRNAPRALTKEELYEHVWGDTIVEEVNLANLVSEIRAALGDTRKNHRFLKTIHAYGYAFVAEVSADESREVSPIRLSPHVFSLFWRGEELPLKPGDNIVGRDETADIVIDSVSVSRAHARITVDGQSAVIEDLQSKNGTFVRGKRIDGPTALGDKDEVKVGLITLSFRVIRRAETTVTNLPEKS